MSSIVGTEYTPKTCLVKEHTQTFSESILRDSKNLKYSAIEELQRNRPVSRCRGTKTCMRVFHGTAVMLPGHLTFQLLPEPTSMIVGENSDTRVLVSHGAQLLTHEQGLVDQTTSEASNAKKSGQAETTVGW